ncbi:MAG: hypothetical protein ACREF7_04260 [Candidatus Saccharimonadales bacterium]
MPTTKSRMNLSLPDDVDLAIKELAKRDKVPAATKAESLLEIALEIEEDQIWDRIAVSRDLENAKYYTHEEVFRDL